MKSKLLNDAGPRTYAVVLETGEEVLQCLNRFAVAEKLKASHLTAIGTCSRATLGFFDFSLKDYRKIFINEQVEMLSLLGDITQGTGSHPGIHAHAVVGKADGTAHGGHLLEAVVHPTLEIILSESPAYLARETDPETGLALIRIET